MGVHADTKAYKAAKKALGIPEDEPIFVLRAQDALSVAAISRYDVLAKQIEKNPPSQEWFEQLDQTMTDFRTWQTTEGNAIKVPD